MPLGASAVTGPLPAAVAAVVAAFVAAVVVCAYGSYVKAEISKNYGTSAAVSRAQEKRNY